ncbi:GGDEF domain-containing protein [uncultured Roseovarius sp.]|uniref:GGDEF domain-containing protein n=1 Tax=uncultured Roseovarius sp. TaxID=293344 RepID=UPI0025DA243F|nr:GGDEF domain-containing protein [uncultured Roseovarius sp.]
MKIRLRTRRDVTLFALAISLLAVLGSLALRGLLQPADVYARTLVSGSAVAAMLAAPIAYYIGLQMLDTQRLTQALEHAVNHDSLTGASTRASFEAQVAQLPSGPKAIMVVDIDHFKTVNDRFGHQAGDSALCQFALRLKRNCREDDIIARFGGEEFVVLLHNVSLADAQAAAERLCAKLREAPIILNGQAHRLTASFGVAPLVNARELDDALAQADAALYRAKSAGRDRVFTSDTKAPPFSEAS